MDALISRLSTVTSAAEFHELLFEHGVLSPDPRFIHLELDISSKCNLRCRMCYFSFDEYFHGRPVYLSPEAFERLATIFPNAHTVTLSLGSEPLTSPHFVRLLEMLAAHNVPNVSFYTNGVLMSDRIIDAIMSTGVTLVCLSIDGATPATFERIRRGGHFHQFVANVARLAERKRFATRPLPVLRFHVVMMKSNVHELEGLVDLAATLGVDEINFFHLVVYEGLDMEGESLVHHKALSNLWLGRARDRAGEVGVKVVAAPAPFRLDGQATSAANESSRAFLPTPYCQYPFYHVSMNAGGHVLACPFSHGEAPFGTLGPDTPFERIWFGEAFTTLRRRILTHDPPDMCRRCSFLASRHPDLGQLFAPRSIALHPVPV